MGKRWPAFCAFRVSLRYRSEYRSEYRSDSPPKPENFAHTLSVQGMCQNQLRSCASQPGLLSGDLVAASETYKQLEAQQHHAAPFTCATAPPLSPQALFEHEGCGFGVVLGIVLSKQYFGGQKCSSHSPSDPQRCFRRSKITFGYGFACRLWRLRVQARSMSSRKASNRWPRMQFTLPE